MSELQLPYAFLQISYVHQGSTSEKKIEIEIVRNAEFSNERSEVRMRDESAEELVPCSL